MLTKDTSETKQAKLSAHHALGFQVPGALADSLDPPGAADIPCPGTPACRDTQTSAQHGSILKSFLCQGTLHCSLTLVEHCFRLYPKQHPSHWCSDWKKCRAFQLQSSSPFREWSLRTVWTLQQSNTRALRIIQKHWTRWRLQFCWTQVLILPYRETVALQDLKPALQALVKGKGNGSSKVWTAPGKEEGHFLCFHLYCSSGPKWSAYHIKNKHGEFGCQVFINEGSTRDAATVIATQLRSNCTPQACPASLLFLFITNIKSQSKKSPEGETPLDNRGHSTNELANRNRESETNTSALPPALQVLGVD